jgi:hypothetical protein
MDELKWKTSDKTASNERFGTMAGVPRWKVGEKQQVKWLVASVGSPPLRQAATTLYVMPGQRVRQEIRGIKTKITA